MKTAIALVAAFAAFVAVIAYTAPPPPAVGSPQWRYERGLPVLSSVAPDGTKLWKVNQGNRDIFFSTAGTQTTERHGKITVDVQTPNAS